MWPKPQETAKLVTYIEEILNGKLHFFLMSPKGIKWKNWEEWVLNNALQIRYCSLLH